MDELTKNKIITALRLGRKKRPKKIFGKPFDTSNGACAIGAIAVGLGLPTKDQAPENLGNIAYKFVRNQLGIEKHTNDLVTKIWRKNDDAEWLKADPDKAVIEYIRSL